MRYIHGPLAVLDRPPFRRRKTWCFPKFFALL